MGHRKISGVMTPAAQVVAVPADAAFKDIATLLGEYAVSAMPVVDAEQRALGVMSEDDLLAKESQLESKPEGRHRFSLAIRAGRRTRRKAGATTAQELMTSPPVGRSERVFMLLGRCLQLYAVALGTLRTAVCSARFPPPYGPERAYQSMYLGDAKVLVNSEALYVREVAENRGRPCPPRTRGDEGLPMSSRRFRRMVGGSTTQSGNRRWSPWQRHLSTVTSASTSPSGCAARSPGRDGHENSSLLTCAPLPAVVGCTKRTAAGPV